MQASVRKILRRGAYAILLLLSLLVCLLLLALKSQTISLWLLANGLSRAPVEMDYRSASGTIGQGFNLSDVILVLPGGETLAIGELEIGWDLWALSSGLVHISRLHLQTVHLDLPAAEAPRDEGSAFDPELLAPLFELPVSLRVDDAVLNDLRIREDGQEILAVSGFSTTAHLDSSALTLMDLQLEMPPLALMAETWRLDANRQFSGDLRWRYPVEDLMLAGELRVDGALDRLDIRHRLTAPVMVDSEGLLETGLLSGEAAVVDLRHETRIDEPDVLARLSLADVVSSLSAEVGTQGTLQDLSVAADLRVSVPEAGDFDVALNSRVQEGNVLVNELLLDGSYGRLLADGLMTFSPDLSADLSWRYEAATLPGLPAGISLSDVNASGRLQHDTLASVPDETRLSLAALDAMLNGHALSVEGTVALADFALSQLDLVASAGENLLSVSGATLPEMNLDWMAEIAAPGQIVPGLSGSLSGSGALSGSFAEPVVSADLDVSQLDYSRDGQRLVQLASLNLGGRLEAGELSAELSLSDLLLAGNSDPLRLDSLSLSAAGSQQDHRLTGRADSNLGSLRLQLEGGLETDVWTGNVADADLVSTYGNWRLRDRIALSVAQDRLRVGRHCWDMQSLSLCAELSRDESGELSGSADLSGLPLVWLTRPDVADRHLDSAVSGRLSELPAAVRELLIHYGLSMPAGSFISGELDASASFRMAPQTALPEFSLRLSPEDLILGVVPMADPALSEDQDAAFQAGEDEVMSFTVQAPRLEMGHRDDGWWLQSRLTIADNDAVDSGLQGNLQTDLSLSEDQVLGGSFAMDFEDLAWLSSLLPQLRDTQGRLNLSGQLHGNLERPLLEARMTLDDGAFSLPATGLDITDVTLKVTSDRDNNFSFSGGAASGEGALQFDGVLHHPLRTASRHLEMNLAGEQFRVFDLTGARIDITPVLALVYTDGIVSVTGGVDIPWFDVVVEEAIDVTAPSAITPSRDVVLYESEAEEARIRERSVSDMGIEGRIDITLGEHVRLQAYGLDLLLEGGLTLEQAVNAPLLTYGEVSVTEGFYEMYGQRLTAERGELLFFGNPLNPALEIRASREVDSTTVGIQINGTLNNMQSRLYSVPTLPEAEVLAMLVTGRSLGNSNAQGLDNARMLAAIANLGIKRGQGVTDAVQRGLGVDTLEISGGTNLEDSSLGIGKYVTPDLFVRYDVGLFDRESVLSMIYSLTERIRLEVESGASQSLDIIYTLER